MPTLRQIPPAATLHQRAHTGVGLPMMCQHTALPTLLRGWRHGWKRWLATVAVASTALAGSAMAQTGTPRPLPQQPPQAAPTAPTGGAGGAGAARGPFAVSVAEIALLQTYLAVDVNNLFNYAAPSVPVHYDATVLVRTNTPANNPVTDAGATLGRVLFNDKQLSINNTVSCASCHQQALGFSDASRFSAGVKPGIFSTAYAMRLGNIAFYRQGSMFWDKRTANVEAQATQPITHPNEMGFDAAHGGMDAVISKMQTLPYYPVLFRWVFGSPTITASRIEQALAQFERAMLSTDSRWDQGYARVFNAALPDRGLSMDVPGLTVQENAGRRLFMLPRQQGGAACAACHQPPTFALAANSLSNGLDAGEATIFKSPALKNVALSKAWMHDGRFSSLEQVVDHYDHGIQNGPALDNRLRDRQGQPQMLNLSAADKAALVAFMKTLTDTHLTTDPKFSDPFK